MKKCIAILAALMAVSMCVAETDYVANERIDNIRKGKDCKDAIETLRVTGNATIAGTLAVTGTESLSNLTVTGVETSSGRQILTAGSLTGITNGQALAINTYPVYKLYTSVSGPTVTVANATSAGTVVHLINMAATNILLDPSATLLLDGSGRRTNEQYDTMTLYAVATNLWVELGRSNNTNAP